jgi:putative oxidoreductase
MYAYRTWPSWAPLPLRLILGIGFLYHGYPKVFSAQEHANFTGMLQGMGIPAPALMSWVAGIVEFFGGLALILGAFTTIAAVLLVIDMLVAMFKVHLPQGFSFMHMTMTPSGPTFGMPGYEVNLLYIAGLLALALSGAGAYSVDEWMARRGVGARTGSVGARPATA